MLVSLRKLENIKVPFVASLGEDAFPGLFQDLKDFSADPKSVKVEGELRILELPYEGYRVTGSVIVEWHLACDRCAEPLAWPLDLKIEAKVFSKEVEDLDAYVIEGEHIDLEPIVRDAIFLALPSILTKDDKEGECLLCPKEPRKALAKAEKERQNPFAVLKDF